MSKEVKHITEEEARALGRFIPVTEALPMNKVIGINNEVLAQVNQNRHPFFYIINYWNGFNRSYNDQGTYEFKDVVAWMPLPIPYIPNTEEETHEKQ